jgi:hypothetical protein
MIGSLHMRLPVVNAEQEPGITSKLQEPDGIPVAGLRLSKA